MGFGEAVVTCLRKYAVFRGRARRSEYWWFTLALVLAGAAAVVLDTALGTTDVAAGTGAVEAVLTVATLLPSLAVSVRRLHDTGRSGWALLLVLVPIVGLIVLIVWACQDSEARDNQHGPWPKHGPQALGLSGT